MSLPRGGFAARALHRLELNLPLRAAFDGYPLGIHLGHGHHDSRQLRRIQEDVAKQQLIRAVIQTADYVPMIRCCLSLHRQSPLASAIERRDHKAGRRKGQVSDPVAAI